MLVFTSQATHYRAADLWYELVPNQPNTYRVTLTTYTLFGDPSSPQSDDADRDSVLINWGDGFIEGVRRSNGPTGGVNNIPQGELIGNFIKRSIYVGTHTYSGAIGTVVVGFEDPNRTASIINIGNSVQVPFYIEDTIFNTLNPAFYGLNESPILLNPPIDFANVGDTFIHNPNAFEPNGDSLNFRLIPPKFAAGSVVPNYRYPNEVIPGPNNNFTINPQNGEILWAVPQQEGIYNIAILIEEWRRIANGSSVLVGTTVRDMQIIVGNENNSPPQIRPINDTCIVSNDTFFLNIQATDPNINQTVTLTAEGEPFLTAPGRVFFNANAGNPAQATFRWDATCADIDAFPYQIVFKAQDDYVSPGGTPFNLVDLETWFVTIVPEAPTGLTASVFSNDVQLTWDSLYTCATNSRFQYFSIWRGFGCDSLAIGPCVEDLASLGFEFVDTTSNYNYLDINVDRGHEYRYVVVANFGDQGISPIAPITNFFESLPSEIACVQLPLDLPVITHATVNETSTTVGEIFIDWTKPRAGNGNLDTIQDPGPYVFQVFASEGFNLANPQLKQTYSSSSFSGLNDTTYLDTLLNTEIQPYSYQVAFYSQNGLDTLGTTAVASSVFLEIIPSNETLNLSWQENVPWVNYEYTVFRLNNVTNVYDSIALTTEPNYLDTGLINDSTYCYYIRSEGRYTLPGIVDPIINFSQFACDIPRDTVAPCSPALTVANDCDNENDVNTFTVENRLSWVVDTICADDVERYYVYYAPNQNSTFSLLGTTPDLQFTHQLTNNLSGCYYVVAEDVYGNQSRDNDTVCTDNCPVYVLPNAFTPNGDGQNDLFKPFPYRFVERIELKIYNRWGNVVFETENPDVNWDGTDQKTGEQLNEGVYLYSGFVFVTTANGTIKLPLQLNEGKGGYIHLYRAGN